MGKYNSVVMRAAHWLVGDDRARDRFMNKSEFIVSTRVSAGAAMRKSCVEITEHKANMGTAAFGLARS